MHTDSFRRLTLTNSSFNKFIITRQISLDGISLDGNFTWRKSIQPLAQGLALGCYCFVLKDKAVNPFYTKINSLLVDVQSDVV